jgi:Flp pilus assembly protein TadG
VHRVRERKPASSVMSRTQPVKNGPALATVRGGRYARSERGVALVEFALVAPLFMLLLLGMIDLGKAFNYWIDMTHMANQGARLAVVNYHPASGTLQNYICASADTSELKNGGTASVSGDNQTGGLKGVSICITYPGSGSAVGQPVRFTVAAKYNWLPLLGGKIGIASSTIRGTAEMRLEQTPDFSSGNINPSATAGVPGC